MRPNVRKPPACVAGGGFLTAQRLLDKCQALHPARKPDTGLEPVIRMAFEMGRIAWDERMSLKAVEQSGRAGVKVWVWTAAAPNRQRSEADPEPHKNLLAFMSI